MKKILCQFHPYKSAYSQRGLTLIELLVALALGSMIVLAAVAALTVSRQGFSTVDASSQLRDNGRFATSIMRRLITQAGYLDFKYASTHASSAFKMGDPTATGVEPSIKGFNNAAFSQALAIGTTNSPSATGINNSDMLVLRFQPGSVTMADGTEKADYSMIDCLGNRLDSVALSSKDRIISVFHIDTSVGEPTLMCTSRNETTGIWQTQPLVQGIESLQILYGVDGVTPGSAPAASSTTDSVPEQYLRADEMVTSNAEDTNENWARVRSVRVGMVMRGPVGSSSEKTVPAQYPLGKSGVMNSSSDPGSEFASKDDARLRQTLNFTVHLRNPQDPA